MNALKKFLVVACAAALGQMTADAAKLNVVATLPDFGAIAEKIGGERVTVSSICRGTEDAHFVDARPSFVRLLNQADVLLEGGADLEAGWLPTLLNSARNGKIMGDSPGHIVLSRGLRLLDIPSAPLDRSMGDVHPRGNPHFWMDPANAKIMARTLAEGLSRVDPTGKALYETNCQAYSQAIDEKLSRWSKILEPYRGTKVVTYHKSFNYFLERFGFELAGTIEPKPGIEPSPSHISTLVTRLKSQGVKLVIIEPFRPRKTPLYVAEALGAKLLVIPDKVRGVETVKDEIAVFDYNVTQIAGALGAK